MRFALGHCKTSRSLYLFIRILEEFIYSRICHLDDINNPLFFQDCILEVASSSSMVERMYIPSTGKRIKSLTGQG